MADPWPPVPIRISGGVVLRLFGAELLTITLDLAIVATQRVARWMDAVGQVRTTSPMAALQGADDVHDWTASIVAPHHEAKHSRTVVELRGNGGGAPDDEQLQEILRMLDETSKLLD